jgi:hypothetical protein
MPEVHHALHNATPHICQHQIMLGAHKQEKTVPSSWVQQRLWQTLLKEQSSAAANEEPLDADEQQPKG